MQRNGMRRGLIAAAVAVLSLIPVTGARADDVALEGTAYERKSLLSLTPPVAGYSTFLGVVYDAAPFSYERALFARGGLRLTSTAIVYHQKIQGYGLILGVPLYLDASRADRPYGGWYAAPILAAVVDRFPTTQRTLSAGAEVGYAWTFAERWRFLVGLGSVFELAGLEPSGGGLSLALGAWL